MEYLVTMTTHVPDGTPAEAVDDVRAREAARSRELAAQRGYRGGRDHAIGTVASTQSCEDHDSLAGVGRELGREWGDSASGVPATAQCR